MLFDVGTHMVLTNLVERTPFPFFSYLLSLVLFEARKRAVISSLPSGYLLGNADKRGRAPLGADSYERQPQGSATVEHW